MPSITVEVEIAADPASVWAVLEDIGSHTEWMTDAEQITFRSSQRRGEGTEIDVLTKVGPLRTSDRMRFTEWEEGRRMGVRHEGLVKGTGSFRLTASGGATLVTWHEDLEFPWVFGGPLGASVAKPILRRIWRANLARLKAIVEVRPR